MAEPTLDQMISALEQRKAVQAPQPNGLMDMLRALIMPRQTDPVLPRFDAQGNQINPRNVIDLMGSTITSRRN